MSLEKFEVENGILGLERDVYLNIVKFLHSTVLRLVKVNFFLNFLFLFYCLYLFRNKIHQTIR
jgi:hypothetical protein